MMHPLWLEQEQPSILTWTSHQTRQRSLTGRWSGHRTAPSMVRKAFWLCFDLCYFPSCSKPQADHFITDFTTKWSSDHEKFFDMVFSKEIWKFLYFPYQEVVEKKCFSIKQLRDDDEKEQIIMWFMYEPIWFWNCAYFIIIKQKGTLLLFYFTCCLILTCSVIVITLTSVVSFRTTVPGGSSCVSWPGHPGQPVHQSFPWWYSVHQEPEQETPLRVCVEDMG